MGSRNRRTGRDSRCCDASAAPFSWRDFVDPDDGAVENMDSWIQKLSPFARAHELGEIDDLFDAASQGELWDTGDATTPIKPIREDPEIFELRRTALSKRLRFYHGEPQERQDLLVAVHRHIKSNDDDQQVQIEVAADRYDDGRSSSWTR
jgi:hypothetical protein